MKGGMKAEMEGREDEGRKGEMKQEINRRMRGEMNRRMKKERE
jgi:hypothetical protein